MRPVRMAIFGLFVAGGLAAVWWLRPTTVEVVPVMRGAVAEVVYGTGVVEPLRWAKLAAQSRARLIETCGCEGREVVAGQILAKLDDTAERAVLTELETRRDQARRERDRAAELVKRAFAPQARLEETGTALATIEAQIAAQAAHIDQLVLRAPLAGVVLREDAAIGEIVDMSDILFWIGEPKPLRIEAEVAEEDIPRVRVGQRVMLRNDGFPHTLSAHVGSVTPKGDPESKTFRVYLSLPEDSPLSIGMSVEANIITCEKQDALLVPAEAVEDGHVLLVQQTRLKQQSVELGIRGSRIVEILRGLREGDLIAAVFDRSLTNGTSVRAIRSEQ